MIPPRVDVARSAIGALVAPAPAVGAASYVDALGGPREGIRWLALAKIGADPTGPLPPAGPDRKRYLAARRDVERWRAGTRTPNAANREWLESQRTAVRAVATRRRLDRLRRRGIRVRMGVKLRVSRDERGRVIPAPPAPGVLLERRITGAVVTAALAGDFDQAGGLLVAGALSSWAKGADESMEITEVYWVKAWADGDAEPDDD